MQTNKVKPSSVRLCFPVLWATSNLDARKFKKMSGTKSTGWLWGRKRIAGGESKQQHFVFIHFLSIFCKWKRCRRNGDSVAPEKLDLPLVFVCGFCLLSFCNHHHQFCYSTPTPHRISPVEIVVLNSNGLFLVCHVTTAQNRLMFSVVSQLQFHVKLKYVC